MNTATARYVLASYYLTKNNIPSDIILFIISLTIQSERKDLNIIRPPFNSKKYIKKESIYYIIDDDWICRFGSQNDIISEILPYPCLLPIDGFHLNIANHFENVIPFSSRKNLTVRPSGQKRGLGEFNILFKPLSPKQNPGDILLFFKYQFDRESVPIYLFSDWVDPNANIPFTENLLSRLIKAIGMHSATLQQKEHLFFYEHVRFDPPRVDKVLNSNLLRQDISTGDIIIVSSQKNLQHITFLEKFAPNYARPEDYRLPPL